MKLILIISFLFFSNLNGTVSSQQVSDEPILYIYVDELPRLNYDGGLKKYIIDNLQWPNQLSGEGYVLVSFVVQTNGKVKDLKNEKSLCPPQCYEEVKRIFESIPDWDPGKLDSGEVDVKLYLPIEFKFLN